MRPLRIASVVAGAFGALVALALVAAGSTLIWAHATQRDAAGYYTTPTAHLTTAGYALTGQVDFGAAPTDQDWVPAHLLGTVRIRATGAGGAPLFLGIGPESAVDSWLAGVAHTHVTSVDFGPFATHTQAVAGDRAPAAPQDQSFWVASATGAGTNTLTWKSEGGQWEAVVMNAGAGAGVAVAVDLAAQTGFLLPLGIALLGFGLVLFAAWTLLIIFGLQRPAEETAAAAPAAGAPALTTAETPASPGYPAFAGSPIAAASAGAPPATAGPAYPARLDGHLDPTVSRWLWLFKWVLVVPHAFCLVFLWLAVGVLTVAAGVAILFTGRYPRTIFDFNVGVMRWTWRVGFYAINAFGTDRYPPFSLEPDPSYPADFDVEYPEHLSRGLVLVKWWLLAIPHYLVVAVFAGGIGLGWGGSWRGAWGSGLIALLALIGAVVLAFSGRYPQSMFDFIMAMNRWCYRVLAYVALMRDEYPPFRLDMGGTDPGTLPVAPPPPPPATPTPPAPGDAELVGAGAGT